jgi:hypothetical protein
MANIHLPNNTICNSIAHNIAYNANYDIVWSFDYSLSGNTSSQGSFTTFLFDGDSLSGGGPGIGGAYYSPGSFLSGGNSIFSAPVVSAILGINFDTTGLFALSSNSVSKGILSTIPNSLTVRYGQTNFEYLTSVALTSLYTDFKFLLSSQEFNRLRFRLTDIGQTLKIDYKNQNNFTEIFKIPVSLNLSNDTTYKVGIGYTSPVSGGNAKQAILAIKNFHIEGKTDTPNSNIIEPKDNSFAVYPVCALPAIEPPSDPTVVRALPRIFDVPCVVGDQIADSPESCLASFEALSSIEQILISGITLDNAYTYITRAAAPVPSAAAPINITCGTTVSAQINFNANTRNTHPFPIRYIVDVGSEIGTSIFTYTIRKQPIKIAINYGTTSTTFVSSLSYASPNSNQTFNLLSEFALRNIPISSEQITQTISGTHFIERNNSSFTSQIEILVYAPVHGGEYTFRVGCPEQLVLPGGSPPLTGSLITGINLKSPVTDKISYYPYYFNGPLTPWKNNTLYKISYSARDLPERFQVVDLNTETVLRDTEWIGNSDPYFIDRINRYLARVGEPPIDTLSNSISTTSFRTIGTGPIGVRVRAPLYNSTWAFIVSS